VHQVRGTRSLAEVLSLAGGLKPDAGYRITITRQAAYGVVPLKDVHVDAANKVSTGDVVVSDIIDARNPAGNIQIFPNDLITVPRAKLIYVMGEVRRPGGFTLDQRNTVPVLQALALAEGLTPNASKKHTIIMRQQPGTDTRAEIPVDITKILHGKAGDATLQANDILFVPNSVMQSIRAQAIAIAVATGTGILIWRGF
jgi:polysaccharide export outer membrane protein